MGKLAGYFNRWKQAKHGQVTFEIQEMIMDEENAIEEQTTMLWGLRGTISFLREECIENVAEIDQLTNDTRSYRDICGCRW